MKKIYYLSIFLVCSVLVGRAQCTLDSSNTYFGFSPVDTALPVIIQGSPYANSIQFYSAPVVADSTDTIQILSTILDSTIGGIPRGLAHSINPASTVVPSGGRFCIEFTGTTNAGPGAYPLTFTGTVHIKSLLLGDTIISIQALDTLVASHNLPMPYVYSLFVQIPYVAPCNGLDSNNLTQPGVWPPASDLPCIVQSVPYFETIQGMVQSDSTVYISLPVVGNVAADFHVDSVRIDSITGVPAGISYGISPRVIQGGGKGCVSFYGTSNADTGTYQLGATGVVWFTVSAYGQHFPYSKSGNLAPYAPFSNYYLRVVSVGDSCSLTLDTSTNTGIKTYSPSLNAKIKVFPNPTSGLFTLQVDAASPVNGKVTVYDAIGRQVHQQPIDVLGPYTTTIDLSNFGAGLYTLQISTPQGNATTKISVQ